MVRRKKPAQGRRTAQHTHRHADRSPAAGAELGQLRSTAPTAWPATSSTRFESLLAIDNSTGAVIPALATEWTVAEDGSVYSFKLR
ncbi:MAG: hypothetical protein R2838_16710 [Caldilineaceae bacterium]